MYILAIETTGPFGSVALINEEGVLGELTSADEMNHLKDLLPMTGRLLSHAGVGKSELSYIAVSQGPGSFTGIRIGVATARALGQALDLPVIGVPTLQSFAYKEERDHGEQVVCGILNARRGQVYGIVEGFMEDGPYMLTDVLQVITEPVKEAGQPVIFYGDGIDAYEEKIIAILGEAGMSLDRDFYFAPKETRYQNAGAVGRMALEKARAGQILKYNDLHPDYMRKAEAEQKLEAGELPICKLPKQE
ncbi:MAG: tRNA (adenosine(37)-N6)-threonylcarbamoyltransferase complex dimerization subunit type 1 TsaB [Firmicutes bacterium]|jgi:tRNA threonylcarbamoyladenosine biosynthesis protein TsaB|nr:tRNA (adenosine(37)-N6)-threonylcarbamoyltransferase complex dimerization subunit type 1 TsaB [Bacillota bacterium]